MQDSAHIFDALVQHRRAVRRFDSNAPFDEDAVRRSLQRAHLSPSSSNLQLWEFYRVKSEEKRAKLASFCLGQNAALTSRELVVIVVRRDLWPQRCAAIIQQQLEIFNKKNGENLSPKEKRIVKYWEKTIPTLQTSGFGFYDFLKKINSFFKGLKKPVTRAVNSRAMLLSAHRSVALAAMTFMWSMAAEGYDSCPMEGFDSQRVKTFLNLPSGAEISMIIAVGVRGERGIYGPRMRIDFEEVYFEL